MSNYTNVSHTKDYGYLKDQPVGAGRKKREEAMYSQAELVLKKKAEIEAKMAANTKNDKNSKVGSIHNRKPITMSIKSRWGLKGKKVLPAGAVPPVTSTSTIENDNSWEKYTTPLQSSLGPPPNLQQEQHSVAVYTEVSARHSPPPPHFDPPQMTPQPQTLSPAVQPQQLPPSYFPSVSEPHIDVRFGPNMTSQLPPPALMSQPPPAPAPPPAPSFDISRPPPRYPPPSSHPVFNHAAPPPPVMSQEGSIPIHTIPPQHVVSYPHPGPPQPTMAPHPGPPQQTMPPQPTMAMASALPPTSHIQTGPHMMNAPHMSVGLAPNMSTSLVSTLPPHQIQMQNTNPMNIQTITTTNPMNMPNIPTSNPLHIPNIPTTNHMHMPNITTTNPMNIPSISHLQSASVSHLQSTHATNMQMNNPTVPASHMQMNSSSSHMQMNSSSSHMQMNPSSSHMQMNPSSSHMQMNPSSSHMQSNPPGPHMQTNPPGPHMQTNPPGPHMQSNPLLQTNPPGPHMQTNPHPSNMQTNPPGPLIHNNPPQMSMAPISHLQMGPISHMQSVPVSHIKPTQQLAPSQMVPSSHMQSAPQMSLPTPESHLQPIYHLSAGPPNMQTISSSHLAMSTGPPPPQPAPPMTVGDMCVHSAPPPHHMTSVPPPHFVPNPHTPMSMTQAPPHLLVTHSAPPPILTDRPPPFHQSLPPQHHSTPSSMAPSITSVPPPGGGKPAWWSETISKAKEIATSMGRPTSPPPGMPPAKQMPGTGPQNASGWSMLENQVSEGGRWQENDARSFTREEQNQQNRGGDSRRHEEGRDARQKERFSDEKEDRYSPRSGKDRDNRYRRQSGEEQHGFRSKESGGRRFRDTDLRRSKEEEDDRFGGSRERRDSRDNLGHKRTEQRRYSEDFSKGSKSKNYEDGNLKQDKDLRERLDSRTGEDPERSRAGSKGSYESGKCLDIDLRKSSRETEVYSPTRPTYTPTKKPEVSTPGEGLPSVVEELASMVAISGEDLEEVARGRNQTTPELKFLFEKNSSLYSKYRARVSELKKTLEETDNKKRVSGGQSSSEPPKKRRSRWGSKESSSSIPPPGVNHVGQPGMVVPTALGAPGLTIPTQLGAPGMAIPMQLGAPGVALPMQLGAPGLAMPTQLGAPGLAIPMQLGGPVGVIPTSALMPRFQQNMKLSEIQRSNPGLVSYAVKVFGTTDLCDAQWKQCEDQLKMSVVYGQLAAKQAVSNASGGKGRNKFEYDSDEDTTQGTWEHKQRKQEMLKTEPEAGAANLGEGSHQTHHIGDYLPPEELTKFMNKYKALRNGDKWDSSEYQDNKLQSDNKGFKMLQKMGWSEGAGLGSAGMGITAPIGKSGMAGERMGLGVEKPGEISANDDEFDSYRKRMMMAYRFRPNPLNNPRRAYY